MIKSIYEKKQTENQIQRLENILMDLKEKLLPCREEQYKAMAAVYVRRITEFREEIEAYTGMEILLIEKTDINIHIKGPIIDYGSAPISIISTYLDNFRKSIQKIHGILNNIEIKKRASSTISQLTDFRLMAYQPGSINLSLCLPQKQIGFLDHMNIDNSLDVFFDILDWLSDDEEVPEKLAKLDSVVFEKLLINILKTLPDEKNITNIEFSGKFLNKKNKIYVDCKSKEKVIDTLNKIESVEKLVGFKGCIREIDLDKLTFVLRNIETDDCKQLKCKLGEYNMDDVKDYLDTTVSVTGVKRGHILDVKYIEII